MQDLANYFTGEFLRVPDYNIASCAHQYIFCYLKNKTFQKSHLRFTKKKKKMPIAIFLISSQIQKELLLYRSL
jgi:hypothetical protein